MSDAKKAAFVFIYITVALDMLALGIIIPVLPKLILQFRGNDSSSAAEVIGLFATVYAAMQFLFSPVLGVLSGAPYFIAALLMMVAFAFASRSSDSRGHAPAA